MSSIVLVVLTLVLLAFFVLCATWAFDLRGRYARQRVLRAKRSSRASSAAADRPGAAGSSHGASWNPYAHYRHTSDEDATYRARRSADPDELPKWDPYAEEQSRVHRIRAARGSKRVADTPNHYELLGLERTASDAQIEQAYRRYVAQIHPDRFFDNPSRRAEAELKMRQLNAVMEVLRDPLRRARYDAGQDRA